jgi:hypothetical protein
MLLYFTDKIFGVVMIVVGHTPSFHEAFYLPINWINVVTPSFALLL